MARQNDHKKDQSRREENGITQITVSGFKSINREQSIEIRPLTILAGANSSGKSSMMQPLLLFKQTLEETYDPGALLLYGPNVKFTSADQLLSRVGKGQHANLLRIGIAAGANEALTLYFHKQEDGGFEVQQMDFSTGEGLFSLRLGMSHEEVLAATPARDRELYEKITQAHQKGRLTVVRERSFLALAIEPQAPSLGTISIRFNLSNMETHIRKTIHLPGFRGNPERTYPVTATSSVFPGTFENYTASIIVQWQTDGQKDKLENLNRDLERLSLTWRVTAKPINDAQVELQVGRLARPAKRGTRDLINIADVGFGVSQTLPVLVALHVAEPEQLVYLEQPELHLHPRAQYAMAQVLADAASRGVRIVAETHSSLLLLGVQALVAEGKLAPEKVKLHWFKRRDDGSTEITSADLDETGAFGDWPEDFADVALEAESRYLDAAETRHRKNNHAAKKIEASRH